MRVNRTSLLTMVVAIVVVVAILVLVIGVPSSSPKKASSTIATETGADVTVTYDYLVVGFQAGLWNLSITNSGSVGITSLMAIMSTPVQTEVCTGVNGGLSFFNCPATSVSPYLPGATLHAYASGAGPGSAVVGTSYEVVVSVTYSGGESMNYTSQVTAQGPS